MSKKEVCAYLGKSARTVAGYMADGRLPFRYEPGPTGQQAMFDRSNVERFKGEMVTPTAAPGKVTADQPGVSVGRTGGDLLAALAGLVELAKKYQSDDSPWLTLREAARWSNLPASYLLDLAENGSPIAIDVGARHRGGRWRFLRERLGVAVAHLPR
jgi:hypothetical protein